MKKSKSNGTKKQLSAEVDYLNEEINDLKETNQILRNQIVQERSPRIEIYKKEIGRLSNEIEKIEKDFHKKWLQLKNRKVEITKSDQAKNITIDLRKTNGKKRNK